MFSLWIHTIFSHSASVPIGQFPDKVPINGLEPKECNCRTGVFVGHHLLSSRQAHRSSARMQEAREMMRLW